MRTHADARCTHADARCTHARTQTQAHPRTTHTITYTITHKCTNAHTQSPRDSPRRQLARFPPALPPLSRRFPAALAPRVQNKKRLRVVEWSLNQTSLDEVFMNVAQAAEAEYHISGPVSGSSFASGSAPVDVVV